MYGEKITVTASDSSNRDLMSYLLVEWFYDQIVAKNDRP